MKNLKEIKETIMAELNKIQSDEDRCNAILKLFTESEENKLLTLCENIRDDWTENVTSYLENYGKEWEDEEYVVYHDGSFKGARLLVAGGGPTVWLDTATGCVEGGAFGEEPVSVYLPPAVTEEINDFFREIVDFQ